MQKEKEMIPEGSFAYHRSRMRSELEKDEGLRDGYQSNIAMLLFDKYGIKGYDERNNAANDILNLIFDLKCKPIKYPLD